MVQETSNYFFPLTSSFISNRFCFLQWKSASCLGLTAVFAGGTEALSITLNDIKLPYITVTTTLNCISFFTELHVWNGSEIKVPKQFSVYPTVQSGNSFMGLKHFKCMTSEVQITCELVCAIMLRLIKKTISVFLHIEFIIQTYFPLTYTIKRYAVTLSFTFKRN